tara:strand:- start:664 stop:927 length:264 start_codon:yes stop_codon:yes gene_type:complete
MSWSDVALIAAAVFVGTALLDWRRGVTGFGPFRLTKLRSPERYWVIVVLYFNLAMGMVWLSSKAHDAEIAEMIENAPVKITVRMAEQ